MRKGLLMLFAVISLHSLAQSPHWIKGHAVWHYDYFNPSKSGALRIETIGDTLILGHTCQKLKCDLHTQLAGANGSYTHLIDTEYKFIYFEQDTVWYLKNNVFFVLYDFTAVQGQVRQLLELSDFGTPPECNDSSYLFIDSVYSGFLNGQSAMFYETRDSSLNSMQHGGLVNSHFGMMSSDFSLSHDFFPAYGWCDQDPNQGPSSYEGPMYRLLCFQDDSLTYNPENVDCDYYTYLGLTESQKMSVSVYPNPSQGKVEVLSEVPLKHIKVMSVPGMLIKEVVTDLTLTTIDLSGLPQGTYYLTIENANGEQMVKSVQISGK